MFLTRLRQARGASLVACSVLTASGLLFPAAPAHASIQYAFLTGENSASEDPKVDAAPYTCDRVSNPSTPDVDPGMPGNADDPPDFTEGGGPVTRTQSYGGVVTNSGNPADVLATGATGSTTVSIGGAGGAFTGFDVAMSGTAGVTAAQGTSSGCYADDGLTLEAESVVTVTQPSWLTIDGTISGTPTSASNPGQFTSDLSIQEVTPYVELNEVLYVYRGAYTSLSLASQKSERHVEVFLVPGQYRLEAEFFLESSTRWYTQQSFVYSAGSSVSSTAHFVGSLRPAGAKDGGLISKSKGKKYVKLLERSCATDQVTAKLSKKKLSSAAKVVFTVNGKKAKTVKPAKKFPKNGLVALTGLVDSAEVVLKVVVHPKAKGSAKPSVQQAYLSCS